MHTIQTSLSTRVDAHCRNPVEGGPAAHVDNHAVEVFGSVTNSVDVDK